MVRRMIDKNPESAVVGSTVAALIIGRSYDWFHEHVQYSPKFMQNVPNKTPNASRPTYLRRDVERFKRLNEWW